MSLSAQKSQTMFKTLKLPLVLAVSSVLLAACSSTSTTPAATNTTTAQTIPTGTTTASTPTGAILDDETLAILEDLLEARDMSMVEGDRMQVERYGNLWDRVRRGYRLSQPAYNDRIEAQKNWFANRQSYLDRLTARASRYLHHTVTEAERRGIPTELALLPIIESSYDPSATSNAAAAGLWQFIPSTGRIYGLNQTSSYDGRRDVIESTRAAYDFLTSLYNQFGSWELALAAYNAGPGRVQRAINANQAAGLPTDYWSLRLPTETMNYVPRFMAVAQIVGAPNQYGVSFPAIANHTHFRTVPVNYGVSLYDVSSATGVSMDELQLLNPALSSLRVDSAGPNRVVIPNSVANSIDARLSDLTGYGSNLPTNSGDLAAYAQANSYGTSSTAPVQTTTYIAPANTVVTSNASTQELQATGTLPTTTAQLTANNTIIQEPPLSTEEREFIAEQIRANAQAPVEPISPSDGNIQLGAVQTGQSVLDARGQTKSLSFEEAVTKPSSQPSQSTQSASQSASNNYATANNTAKTPTGTPSTYVVQRGDNLTSIANRAGVSVNDIANWNQLNPNATLNAGTRLKLYGAKSMTTTASSSNESTRVQSYIVRAGDNLTGVAAANGLSVSQLASYNNLATNARLITGQKLWLVPGKVSATTATRQESASTNYKVQAGDTLIGIAGKLGVTTNDIAELNSFESNARLVTGQTIKVPATKAIVQSKLSNTPSTYTIVSGDTLTGVAAKHGVSVLALASANNLSTNANLIRGRKLTIPVAGSAASSQATKADNNATTNTGTAGKAISNTESYTVKAGDNLTVLASRYGVSVADLARTNNLATNAQIRTGQTLKVPKLTTTHTVKSGENLNSVAKRYGITVAELAKMNNLKTNDGLKIGQKLTVPNR